jgi:DNA-binding winged helix-turn-helix (wHTH) protein
MKKFQFNSNDYSVSYMGEKISFLPKEYKLLEYLFENVNQTLSRQTILDKVWSLSEPTDRTIDDHVYRLRKKLSLWEDFSIETVRGLGYRLIIREQHSFEENPLHYDKEFHESMNVLFNKYILYGQGAGLKTIRLNHELLNLPMENKKEIYLHYVQGEFEWFVINSDHFFTEKLFYMLHIYWLVHFDVNKTYSFFNRALNSKLLPLALQFELETFGIIGIELSKGNYENALNKINKVKSQINDELIDKGIKVYLINQELKLNLYAKNFSLIEKNIIEANKLFNLFPFLREKGIFNILKGLWQLFLNNQKEGILLIDEGLEILSKTKYIPNQIAGIREILVLGNHLNIEVPEKYKKKWLYLSNTYRFNFLTEGLENIFKHYL